MKVISYESHHVMGVKDIKFDLEGRHLFLVGGKNGQGKTSSIKSLLMAVCGRSGMDQYPDPALKYGEDEGWVKVKLSGEESWHEDDHITIELHFTRRPDGTVKEEFQVLDSSGYRAPEPRTLLKQLYLTRAFDPLSFDRMKKSERREVLMDLVGLDFSLFTARRKVLYDERSSVNSESKRRIAVLRSKELHEGVPDDVVSSEELFKKLRQAEKHNAEYKEKKVRHDELEIKIESACRQIESFEKEIAKLRREVSADLDEQEALHGEIEDSLPAIDLDSIRNEIIDLNKTNAKVSENKSYREEQGEIVMLEQKSKELTEAIKSLDSEQDNMLSCAKWPIEGMGVDENGVLLDGLPFESSCKSRRVRASVAVGMSLNPSLRLLVCEDGSDLDLETMEVIQQELENNDFQMIVEVVTRTSSDEDMCAVVISDGEVVKQGGSITC
jgi:DNA repair exonuclease SbcCD ATPase subunit